MPDPSKLKRLEHLGYTVQPCCGMCHNGEFSDGSAWGSCKVSTYVHEKHGARNVSVHWAGKCREKFVMADGHFVNLQRSGFDRFLEGG